MRAEPTPTGSSSPSPRGSRPSRAGLVLALPLLAVHVGLLIVFDLAHHWILALTLLGPAFLWLALAARRLEAARAPLGGAILAGALLLRLALLPLPPTLSDDVLRYLWDGKVATAGFNPYAFAPTARELASLRDETGRLPPHAQQPSMFPPLSIAAFSIAARLPDTSLAWKTLATASDLLACGLLLKLARRLELPEGRAVWYAWNPLVVVETAGMGHVEALGVAAVLGCVLCLTAPRGLPPAAGRRPWSAAVWSAAAVLARLMPLAAVPMWSRQSRRPGRYLAALLVLLSAACLPVLLTTWAETGGLPPGFTRLPAAADWNGPLALPLARLLGTTGAALLLAGLALAAVARSVGERDPTVGAGRLFGILFVLAATVHPWCLLAVLPFAALARHPAWLTLSGLVFLLYLPRYAGVPLLPWVYLAVWLPFAALLLLKPSWSTA